MCPKNYLRSMRSIKTQGQRVVWFQCKLPLQIWTTLQLLTYCHNLGAITHTTNLDDHDYGYLYEQLSTCAHKWEAIAISLRFKGDEIQSIKCDPLNISGGHEACLGVLLTKWLQWAPGDSRGSKNRATLQALKTAVSKAGFGVIAQKLTASETSQGDLGSQTAHSQAITSGGNYLKIGYYDS